MELLVTGVKQALLKLGEARIQEEQGLETETRWVGVGILHSAWMSKDLEVDQEIKTGKQKEKRQHVAASC